MSDRPMDTRFRDYTTVLDAFAETVWVRCPHCQNRARSHRLTPSQKPNTPTVWRLTCTHCGYSNTTDRRHQRPPLPWWTTQGWWGQFRRYNGAVDPVFGLPLWLQTPCCGHVLWAYNREHLDFLAHYVAATLRERQGNKGNHHSIAVRLPRWIKSAKNRDTILNAIEEMRSQGEG